MKTTSDHRSRKRPPSRAWRNALMTEDRHGLRQLLSVTATGSLKVVSAALAFVGFIALARAVGPAENSKVGLIFSAGSLLGIAIQRGGHVTILRFATSDFHLLKRSVMGWALQRSLGLSLLLAPATLLVSLSWLGLSLLESVAVVVLAIALASSELVSSLLRSDGRIIASLAPRDVVWRLFIIAVAIATFSISLSVGLVMLLLACGLLAIALLQTGLNLGPPTRPLSPPERSSLSSHAGAAWLSSTAFAFSRLGDVVIVGGLDPAQAGAYFAANRIATLVAVGIVSLNTVLAPRASRLYFERKMALLQDELRRCVAVVGAGTSVTVALAAVMSRRLLGLFAPEYRSLSAVLIVLLVAALVNAFGGPAGQLMQMVGMERQHAKLMVATQIGGFLLMLLGHRLFGLVGVASAVLVATSCWNFACRHFLREEHGIDPSVLAVFRRSDAVAGS